MAVELALDGAALLGALEASEQPCAVGFFGDFSQTSQATRPAFEQACLSHPERPAYVVDVTKLVGVAKEFGVDAVPTVLQVQRGKVMQKLVGEHGKDFYEQALFAPKAEEAKPAAQPKPAHRVTVYTTDTCPWCVRVKAYLTEQKVPYREINVARDQRAAKRMVAKSGQMGVPQLDIDGKAVVGFDKKKIDSLLGLGRR